MESLSEDHAQLLLELERLASDANDVGKALKGGIKNDEDLGAAGLIVKLARSLNKRAKDAHEKAKAPWLEGGRTVDTFFRETFTVRLTRIADAFQKLGDDYQRAKVAAQRAAAEAEAKRMREEEAKRLEAARAAEEAGRAKTAANNTLKAEDAAIAAEEAEKIAKARAADLVRVQTSHGTISAKDKWTFEITDYQAIDLNALRPYINREAVEQALARAVKISLREAAGVRIYPDVSASFR